jgi:hypothetical protein
MKRPLISHKRWRPVGPLVFLVLTLVLSACDQSSGNGSGNSTGTTKPPVATATTPGIGLGPMPCPATVQAPAPWNAIVGTNATKTVQGVVCGYLMGVPTLQAVVNVRGSFAPFLLDIDVYTAITSTKPVRIFALTGLLQGDVSISNYNTLLTGQVDPNSSQNKGHPPAEQLVDLYREFKWSDSAGTLTQVAFSGLYPDLTRYQAEFEQHEVNTGQGFQQWRLSAVTTAQNFAQFVLGWNPTSPTAVVSGGGTHDARAVVLVKNPSAGAATITLSLSRLELNTNGGIWEVTNVATDGMALTSPQNAQQLTSPVQVTGNTTAFAGKLTSITVFDHDRTAIGQAVITQAGGTGKSSFSASVPYLSSFQGETQEGIIALYTYTASHVITGAVLVKVLLSAS